MRNFIPATCEPTSCHSFSLTDLAVAGQIATIHFHEFDHLAVNPMNGIG
jgi:hypothetical protein